MIIECELLGLFNEMYFIWLGYIKIIFEHFIFYIILCIPCPCYMHKDKIKETDRQVTLINTVYKV